jgi:hypothetical protein
MMQQGGQPPQRRPYRDVLDALQERVRPFIERQPEFARPAYGSVLQSGADMLPGVGDVVGVEDLQAAARDGDPVGIGLGLLAAIPGIPAIGRGSRGARRGLMTGAREAAPSGGLMTDAESALARYRAVNPDDTGARVLNPGDEGYPTNAQWDEASQAYVAPVEPDYPIRAYHGSPHSFDQFSLDKIGTGEGAQVYGHGLYFAESEAVARQYREQLSRDTIKGLDGRVARNRVNGDADEIYSIIEDMAVSAGVPPMSEQARRWTYGGYGELIDGEVTKSGGDWASVPERLRAEADSTVIGMQNYGEPPEKIAAVRDAYMNAALVAEHANASGAGRNLGSMYEVGIDADPQTFLDWDKPLSEQPENVRAAFDSLVHPDVRKIRGRQIEDGSLTGPGVLRAPLGMDSYSDAAASAAWRDAGIPGIRYLDGNSRGVGKGSSNYVVFNDELVKILRKYGMTGVGFGLGASALSSRYDDSPPPLIGL